MKAAMNGAPSFNILDGWWIKGCIEGFTCLSIDDRPIASDNRSDRTPQDAEALYDKLEHIVAPLF